MPRRGIHAPRVSSRRDDRLCRTFVQTPFHGLERVGRERGKQAQGMLAPAVSRRIPQAFSSHEPPASMARLGRRWPHPGTARRKAPLTPLRQECRTPELGTAPFSLPARLDLGPRRALETGEQETGNWELKMKGHLLGYLQLLITGSRLPVLCSPVSLDLGSTQVHPIWTSTRTGSTPRVRLLACSRRGCIRRWDSNVPGPTRRPALPWRPGPGPPFAFSPSERFVAGLSAAGGQAAPRARPERILRRKPGFPGSIPGPSSRRRAAPGIAPCKARLAALRHSCPTRLYQLICPHDFWKGPSLQPRRQHSVDAPPLPGGNPGSRA
jgi:hypothetical protein